MDIVAMQQPRVAQSVGRQIWDLDIAGSSPVARTNSGNTMLLNTTEKEDAILEPLSTLVRGQFVTDAQVKAANQAITIIDRLDKQVEELKAKLAAAERKP